jgi:hypothetical protein
MKFMLLVYLAEDAMNDAERARCYVDSAQLCQDLAASGHYLAANPLQPVATATSLRLRNGQSLLTDGPFAETREQLGGYFLIEAKDREEALSIAALIPAAKVGTIEIRPLMEISGLPEQS